MNPLRKEIFWEIDPQKLDLDINKAIVIERILSFGNMEELKFLMSYYSTKTLLEVIKKTGYLDPKTFEFVISFFHIKKEEMKCFSRKQLVPKHWN